MSTSPTSQEVALKYIAAVGEKRFDAVSELLHPEFEFRMPGKTISGADDYVAALRRLSLILLRNDVRETVVDGDQVCVVYDFVTDTSAGPVASVEWLTVEAGRIREARLIFHKERWPTVLAELSRRVTVAA